MTTETTIGDVIRVAQSMAAAVEQRDYWAYRCDTCSTLEYSACYVEYVRWSEAAVALQAQLNAVRKAHRRG